MSEAEYLAMEEIAADMHEYYEGKVMIKERGNGIKHSLILSNVVGSIGDLINGSDNHLFFFELRVADPSGNVYMYPDVMLVTGEVEIKKDCFDTVINPSVIIEITTDATRNDDMGMKFWSSIQIPSLKEYILIDSTRLQVTIIKKESTDVWKFSTIAGIGQVVKIEAISMDIPFDDIYAGVSF